MSGSFASKVSPARSAAFLWRQSNKRNTKRSQAAAADLGAAPTSALLKPRLFRPSVITPSPLVGHALNSSRSSILKRVCEKEDLGERLEAPATRSKELQAVASN